MSHDSEGIIGRPQKKNPVWAFLNSGFGLWLLSTIVVGAGVWAFNQWQDVRSARAADAQAFSRLTYEIGGRAAQYLRWIEKSTLVVTLPDKTRGFSPSVPYSQVERSIFCLAGPPTSASSADCPMIYPMLPQFSELSLQSVFAEADFLSKRLEGDQRIAFDDPRPRTAEQELYFERSRGISLSQLAMIEPEWLIDYKTPDLKVFIERFYDAFLFPEARNWDFPYTDCFDC